MLNASLSLKERRDSHRLIARQMALSFGVVSTLAVIMCVMLLSIIHDISGLIASMRHDESSIRQGLELTASVRELSLHMSNALIEQSNVHLKDYEQKRDQVRAQLQTLSSRIPEKEQYRLTLLSQKTQRMDDLFRDGVLTNEKRGNPEQTQTIHAQLKSISQQAFVQADAIAKVTTSQMAHAHVLATDSTRIGLLGGGACALLVVFLSVAFTLRLRSAVLKPLEALTQAATHFGQGDFQYRVGRVGRGEFAALGSAFDHMADELARREARMLQNERMAAIGQLAAGIAHELNNPIGIIRGYLKTMQPEQDAQSLREELAILDEEAHHCQRIAEDLLSYARLGELVMTEISMQEFIVETAERFEMSHALHPIEKKAEDVLLEGDLTRLRQVVMNLLKNATEASPQNTPIQVKGKVVKGNYCIEVIDQGPGIAFEERSQIFEPFFSKRKGGSGLGLAVCEGIVKAHEGHIEVNEAPSGGAVFRVWLPLSQKRSNPRQTLSPDKELRDA